MEPFSLRRGDGPLVVSVPHAGTAVPPEVAARFTDAAAPLPDTDWYVDRLYDFVDTLDATVLVARASRYVVDVNRPPDDASLYPGREVTGLVPTTTFAGEPIYRGDPPGPAEVAERVERFWRPYHDALAAELARVRAHHGRVLLWDAHSIASRVPRFFEGELPHLNVGTAGGASCAPAVEAAVVAAARAAEGFGSVVNGRFRGGHVTRAYGVPAEGVHAVQLELAQRGYMVEAARAFDEAAADRLRTVLRRMLLDALAALATLPGRGPPWGA